MHPLNSRSAIAEGQRAVAAARMSTAAATFPPPAAAGRASSGANPMSIKNEARRRPRPRRRRFHPLQEPRRRRSHRRGRHLQALHRRAIMIHPRPGCRLRLRRRLHRPRRRRRRRRFSRGASIGTARGPGGCPVAVASDAPPPAPSAKGSSEPTPRRANVGICHHCLGATVPESPDPPPLPPPVKKRGRTAPPEPGTALAGASGDDAGCLATVRGWRLPRWRLGWSVEGGGLRYPRTYESREEAGEMPEEGDLCRGPGGRGGARGGTTGTGRRRTRRCFCGDGTRCVSTTMTPKMTPIADGARLHGGWLGCS